MIFPTARRAAEIRRRLVVRHAGADPRAARLCVHLPARTAKGRSIIRFIAYAAAGHFLIYSLIAYKTPWLACLPWAHVCLLAGFAVAGFSSRRPWMKTALACLVGCDASPPSSIKPAKPPDVSLRTTATRSPTSRPAMISKTWSHGSSNSAQVAPGGTLEPIGVIGADYWPLPWYLRSFEKIGYWPDATADLAQLPLVFAMPERRKPSSPPLATDPHPAAPRTARRSAGGLVREKRHLERWMETEATMNPAPLPTRISSPMKR